MNTHILHIWTNGNLQLPIMFSSYKEADEYRNALKDFFNGRYNTIFIIMEIK